MQPGHRLHRYTYAEYVALEASSPTKHEFFDGEIYAMAGGTEDHSALAAEVLRERTADDRAVGEGGEPDRLDVDTQIGGVRAARAVTDRVAERTADQRILDVVGEARAGGRRLDDVPV